MCSSVCLVVNAAAKIRQTPLLCCFFSCLQYLGAYASEEAASEAVAEALKQQQQAFAAAQAAVEAVAAEAAGIAHTGVADAMTAADAPS